VKQLWSNMPPPTPSTCKRQWWVIIHTCDSCNWLLSVDLC
jgi:hypothetical protein